MALAANQMTRASHRAASQTTDSHLEHRAARQVERTHTQQQPHGSGKRHPRSSSRGRAPSPRVSRARHARRQARPAVPPNAPAAPRADDGFTLAHGRRLVSRHRHGGACPRRVRPTCSAPGDASKQQKASAQARPAAGLGPTTPNVARRGYSCAGIPPHSLSPHQSPARFSVPAVDDPNATGQPRGDKLRPRLIAHCKNFEKASFYI